MRAILLIAAAILAAGCQLGEPTTIGGTVVNVTEAQAVDYVDPAPKYYDDPLVPEVAWQVDVRLDNGSTTSVTHQGTRRFAPGDRVRLLVDEDGALLL